MGRSDESMVRSQHIVDEQLERAKQFFDPQLKKLGLTEDQIDQQSVEELRASLKRVEDALRHPEAFGVLKLAVGSAAFFVARTEAHIEVGIVPILLERKQLIVKRLRALGAKDVDVVDDRQVQDALVRERATLIVKAEARERRWRLMQSVFQREFVAVTVGGLLLVILGLALIIAMFAGVEPTPVITNVFAVIVGFFFGTTRTREGPPHSTRQTDVTEP